jgi:hypothetical protein
MFQAKNRTKVFCSHINERNHTFDMTPQFYGHKIVSNICFA